MTRRLTREARRQTREEREALALGRAAHHVAYDARFRGVHIYLVITENA